MRTFDIKKVDEELRPAIQAKTDNLNKPKGSLGLLEDTALQICMIQHTLEPRLTHPCHILLGGDHGIEREELTLHVGAGTFKPVKSEEIEGHEMHTEYISVRRDTIRKLIAHDGCAIAVGTTSVRTLESLYYMGLKVMQNPDASEDELHVNQWEPYDTTTCVSTVDSLTALGAWMDAHSLEVLHSSTQIIIAPGYEYHIVKMLVTNFHQPQSTLLLLVSAFVKGDWHKIYDYALANDFRFLSYGDSSLLIP